MVAIILNLDLSTRTKIVSQGLLTITPGPEQAVDLDSFLGLIADELKALAAGINGVAVSGSDSLHTPSVFTIQLTADMPGENKIMNATGHNGRCPNRFRNFHGVYHVSHCFVPPTHPSNGATLYSQTNQTSEMRQSGADRMHAAAVDEVQQQNRSAHHITKLGTQSGVKGPFLFFSPALQDRAKYASLKYLGD